jgi:hypothetical protein
MQSSPVDPLVLLPIALTVAPGALLGLIPNLGQLVANSRWIVRAWCVALVIVALGYGLSSYGLVPPRLLVCYWAPLYQLALYTLALRVFTRALGRAPRDVVYRWFTPGLWWDRAFAWCVVMLSILPVMYFTKPR